MKFQLAKLYRGDHFCGFGIAVNGQLLDRLASVIINTEPNITPTATAVFNLDKSTVENQVVINLDDPGARINFESKPSDEVFEKIKNAAYEGAEKGYRNAVKRIL